MRENHGRCQGIPRQTTRGFLKKLSEFPAMRFTEDLFSDLLVLTKFLPGLMSIEEWADMDLHQ